MINPGINTTIKSKKVLAIGLLAILLSSILPLGAFHQHDSAVPTHGIDNECTAQNIDHQKNCGHKIHLGERNQLCLLCEFTLAGKEVLLTSQISTDFFKKIEITQKDYQPLGEVARWIAPPKNKGSPQIRS